MTRAFFYAGTPSLITTLWAVNDEATRELFEAFYQNLTNPKAPMDKAYALAAAQRAMLRLYEHPYHWAGVVLLGDWDKKMTPLWHISPQAVRLNLAGTALI
jgi:CHAT domain-containing protein